MRTATAVKVPRSASVKPVAVPSASRVLAVLRQTLARSGALQYPPKAVEHAANEMSTRVAFISGTHGQNYGKLKAAMVKRWTESYGNTRAADPVAWQELQERYTSKQDVAFARKYLAKAVAPALRSKVDALLKNPALEGAQVGFLQSWDSASEVIGYDVLQITPKGAKYSLAISLDYVHA